MPKYYIKSGEIQHIIDRKDYYTAIVDVLKFSKNRGLIAGPKICVSEKGFDSYKTWKCYDTCNYLKKIKGSNDDS